MGFTINIKEDKLYRLKIEQHKKARILKLVTLNV